MRLWEAQTGKAGLVLTGHTNAVTSVVYSPSGHRIASRSKDKTVRLWEVGSGQILGIIRCFQSPVSCISWVATANGNFIIAGCNDNSVSMWQLLELDDHYQVYLYWSTKYDGLSLSETSIHDVRGLSNINLQLLQQHGAVGGQEPTMALQVKDRSENAFALPTK